MAHEVLYPEIPRISAAELATVLNSDETKNTVVIDVRGEDFGAHVKGAVNIPVDDLKDPSKVHQLVQQVLDEHPSATSCVFYCGKSQQRGPTGAAKFLEALSSVQGTTPKVVVLEGGITAFTAAHPELLS